MLLYLIEKCIKLADKITEVIENLKDTSINLEIICKCTDIYSTSPKNTYLILAYLEKGVMHIISKKEISTNLTDSTT